jgi:hypothetical protein
MRAAFGQPLIICGNGDMYLIRVPIFMILVLNANGREVVFLISKSKPAGRAPPWRHPFCQTSNKKDAKNAGSGREHKRVHRVCVFYG